MLEVFRPPALHRDRLVLAHRVGGEPVFERGEIDERLERRAGLAPRRDGAVELALGIIAAADQRAHDAVRRHRHQRAFADVELVALLRQDVVERLLGRGLQRRIDRGLDHDVLLDMADQVVDRVHHPVGDVIDRAAAGRFYRARRRDQRALGGVVADHFQIRHGGDHHAGAALGAVGIAARRQPRRRLHQAGQHRRFRQRQLARRFAEIALRRRLDAVGAGAEIDAVEIKLEDLRLGEFVLEPQRQHRLLQLARHRAFLGQEQILGELLGEGRAALRGAAMQHVAHAGAQDAPRIDAVMRVEAAVLDGDERLRHVIRQFAQRHLGAAHVAAGGERRAVEAEDQHRGRPLGDFQRLDRRQVGADPDQEADGGDHRPQGQNRAPIDQPAEAGALLAGALFLARLPGRGIVALAARRGRAAALLRARPGIGVDITLFAGLSRRHVPSPARITRCRPR